MILLGAYLLSLLFRCAKLLWAWLRTNQLRDAAGVAAPPLRVRQVWDRCQNAFGLSGVELLCSATVPSPAAAGAWRRSIILPESLFAAGSDEVLTTAIGHEMAHLARHDFALKVFYEFLSMPVAFHPACWMILRGIEETREMACDELVTRNLLDAECLRPVHCQHRLYHDRPAASRLQPRGVRRRHSLEQRIRRLLHRPAANLKRARLLLAAGLSALAIAVVLSSGVALRAQAQSTRQSRVGRPYGVGQGSHGPGYVPPQRFRNLGSGPPGHAGHSFHRSG